MTKCLRILRLAAAAAFVTAMAPACGGSTSVTPERIEALGKLAEIRCQLEGFTGGDEAGATVVRHLEAGFASESGEELSDEERNAVERGCQRGLDKARLMVVRTARQHARRRQSHPLAYLFGRVLCRAAGIERSEYGSVSGQINEGVKDLGASREENLAVAAGCYEAPDQISLDSPGLSETDIAAIATGFDGCSKYASVGGIELVASQLSVPADPISIGLAYGYEESGRGAVFSVAAGLGAGCALAVSGQGLSPPPQRERSPLPSASDTTAAKASDAEALSVATELANCPLRQDIEPQVIRSSERPSWALVHLACADYAVFAIWLESVGGRWEARAVEDGGCSSPADLAFSQPEGTPDDLYQWLRNDCSGGAGSE